MLPTALEIHPLTPERQADYLVFFDGEAFSDNPKWASCYCQCFYEDHRVVRWAARTAAENRASACQRIASQTMRGYLAYQQGKVVGWCNAAPRPLLHALDEEPQPGAADTGTILCFLVAPRLRGQGVASALLAAACEGLRRVEANPRTGTQDAGANHFGPLSMYLAAGFAVLREDEDGSVWVGKSL
jgi:GNAT superfamily N-acetyltransferase